MQAPPTESLPSPSSCDWCLYPLILCAYHTSELAPYEEPSPSLLYNELPIDWISFSEAAECFRQLVAASTEQLVPYEKPGPSSPYNEVTDEVNFADAEETFRQTVASEELVAAANNRRTTGTGRFHCNLCGANVTARHNLQSTLNIAQSIFASTNPFTRPS